MSNNSNKRWEQQQSAIRATQLAFDLNVQVQKTIKKAAIDNELSPSDQIRYILNLPIKSKKTRQRLSFNLNEEELFVLAERFNLDATDKVEIKQKVAEVLITFTQKVEIK